MGLELRETENLTITNNEFNVADRNILLPVNSGCTYSGNVTITGNVSNNAKERFVRADGTGDAVVVIKNNTLVNYQGEDDDYIKVTNGNNVTIENNTLKSVGVKDANDLKDAIANGTAATLTQDVTLGKIDLTSASLSDVNIDADGHKITTTESYGVEVTPGKNITISNAEIEMTKNGDYITYAAGFKISNGDYAGSTITLRNCTITMANTDFAYAVTMPASVKNLNLVIDNCTLEGAIALQCWGDNNTITITNSELICNYTTSALYTSYCVVLQSDGTYIAENNTLTVDKCEFKYSGIDNFNSKIYSASNLGNNNTVTVTNCTYGEKVVAE